MLPSARAGLSLQTSPPAAGKLSAMCAGDKDGRSPAVRNDFRDTVAVLYSFAK